MTRAPSRAFRTLAQVGTVEAVIVLLTAFDVIHWNTQQHAAVTTLATIVATYVQNLGEERGWWGVLAAQTQAPNPAVRGK